MAVSFYLFCIVDFKKIVEHPIKNIHYISTIEIFIFQCVEAGLIFLCIAKEKKSCPFTRMDVGCQH